MKAKSMKLKRIIALLVAASLILPLLPMVKFSSVTANALEEPIEFRGTNIEAQDYYYNRWSSPVHSYLTETSDGLLMRVDSFAIKNGILVEYYDGNYDLVRTVTVDFELELFGGFYATDTNYFIFSAQMNLDEDDELECYRLTKYDHDWNRISSIALNDGNTTTPFRGASARFAMIGSVMYILTGREMYTSSDGLRHQANQSFVVDTETMTLPDRRHDCNYASHSFNQFIQTEGSKVWTIDHGDGYPRGIRLSLVDVEKNEWDSVMIRSFPGELGDNYTGASVGGFEISDSSYLVAYNATQMTDDEYLSYGAGNIYIGSVDKTTMEVTNTQLTFLSDEDESTSTPHLVKLSDQEFMVLWSYKHMVYYAKLDCKGNIIGSIHCMSPGELSDCKPIVSNGKLVWYTYYAEMTTFYEIDLDDLSDYKITVTEGAHDYEIDYPTQLGGECTLVCKQCGYTRRFETTIGFSVNWNDGPRYEYITNKQPASTYEVGDRVSCYTTDDRFVYPNEKLVTVSDPSGVEYIAFEDGTGCFVFKKAGTYTVTFTDKYNPTVTRSYTIRVVEASDGSGCSHSYGAGEEIAPDCLSDGYTAYTCTKCQKIDKRDHTYALGHDYLSVVTPPTCTEAGYTTNTCARCEDSYFSEWTDALGHDCEVDYPTAQGDDCTVNCTVCDYSHTFVPCQYFGVQWWGPDSTSYSYTIPDTFYETGDTLEIYIFDYAYELEEEYNRKVISISDPSAVTRVEWSDRSVELTFEKAGTYTLTLADLYNPFLTQTYTITVEESNGCDHETWEVAEYPSEPGGDCTIECPDCGRTRTFATASGMTVGWCTDEHPGSYSIPLDQHCFEVGAMIGYSITVDDSSLYPSEKLVTLSDPNGAVHDESEDSITFVRPGVYTVTITDQYNPLITESVTVTVTGSIDGSAADNGCAHSYTTSVIAPACIVQGYTLHTCAHCGDEYLTDYTDPSGHDYADHVSNGDGSKTATCRQCGYADTVRDENADVPITEEAVYNILMSLKDDYPEEMEWTNNEYYRWNGTGFYGGYGYQAFIYILSDAAFGSLPETEINGEITLDMLHVGDIVGFDNGWASVIVLEVQEDHIVCANFDYWTTVDWDDTFTAEQIETYASFILHRYPEDTHFHGYVETVTVPTCTEQGYTTHTCACGDHYTDSYTSALGHGYGEWYVTLEPTVEAAGEERRDCSACDYYETRELPALEKAGIPGDVDGNGKVNLRDAMLLQMYCNRMDVDIDLSVADVDASGDIKLRDAILIQQYVNHLDVELK